MKSVLALGLALASAPLAMTAVPAAARPMADATFLNKAIKGDNSEVSLGRLARTHASSAAVKAYGRMLINDHGAHRGELIRMGARRTWAMSTDGARAERRMVYLHGRRFDEAFKQHMIEDHQKDIAKYEREARYGHSPAVRAMARRTLPTLRKHLAHAEAL